MRLSTAALALSSGAVILLSACSGGTPTPGSSMSNFASAAHVNVSNTAVNPTALRPPKRLAVTNFYGPSEFEGTIVLNRSYKQIQKITNKCPAGAHYDSNGNLYVAQFSISYQGLCPSAGVLEYNKKGALTFTYSTGLGDPGTVTTDASGNVYVSDWGDDKASVVVEYPQGSNTPIATCSTGYANAGVAVDSKGNVFVSVDVPNGSNGGYVLEYKGGLGGCTATTLGVTLKLAGALLIDKHNNIVICDRWIGVDIIPPPYTKIRSTITGFDQVTSLALNKQQNLLYAVSFNYPSANDVVVDKYPSGTNVTTLGASEGLNAPSGVAAYP